MGHKTRRRRGNPKGKALGFHGLKPAARSSSSSTAASTSTPSQSTPSQSTPSAPSSGS